MPDYIIDQKEIKNACLNAIILLLPKNYWIGNR